MSIGKIIVNIVAFIIILPFLPIIIPCVIIYGIIDGIGKYKGIK